ncbi:hypothetical protein JB92DRAFT_1116967 [Gautieria morchelliformis]|nr:hypothetical protein JB92DRAFT_1116967 [Gautieria morchelliformis]
METVQRAPVVRLATLLVCATLPLRVRFTGTATSSRPPARRESGGQCGYTYMYLVHGLQVRAEPRDDRRALHLDAETTVTWAPQASMLCL